MISTSFTAPIGVKIGEDVWPCVEWVDSVSVLGTGKAIKVIGTVEGQPIAAALLPTGRGSHMISLNKKMLKTLGKELGDTVEVVIQDLAT